MPSNAHSTGANNTPLGRVNPALTGGGRRAPSSSLLNPNYLNTSDEEAAQHGAYEKSSSRYESRFDVASPTGSSSGGYQQYQQPSFTPSYTSPPAAPVTPTTPAPAWKRGLEDSNDSDSNSQGAEKKKKRKSRWGNDEKEKTFIPGMPTVLPANLTKDQEEAYLGDYFIDKLRIDCNGRVFMCINLLCHIYFCVYY